MSSSEAGPAVFDLHHHLGSLGVVADDTPGRIDPEDDYRRRTEVMDRDGTRAAALMPSLQYERPHGQADTERVNDAVVAYRDRHADRFPLAFGTVEPLHGVAAGVREIARLAFEKQIDGIVWHHRFQGAFLSDGRMHAFLESCAEHGLPALIHLFAESNVEAAWAFEALATAHPDVTFIGCDAFSGHTRAKEAMAIAGRCANVLYDTAACFPLLRFVEEFVAEFGPDRLLYGSDLYLDPPSYHVPHIHSEILLAPLLTEHDRRQIFWGNAQRVFPKLAGLSDG